MNNNPNASRKGQYGLGMLCALGLAFMFGGIWIGDYAAMEVFALEGSVSQATLVMRGATLVIYGLLFAVVFQLTRKNSNNAWLVMDLCSIVFLVLYVLGLAILINPQALLGHTASLDAQYAAFIVSKLIGAPLSILMVCSFSQLRNRMMMKAALVGIMGAFVIYRSMIIITEITSLTPSGAICIASLFLVIAYILQRLIMRRALNLKNYPYANEKALEHIDGRYEIVKRPAKKVITPGYVIIVIFMALMLGYVRAGNLEFSPHVDLPIIVLLALLFVVALFWKNLSLQILFYGALIAVGFSILVLPGSVSHPVAMTFLDVGTAIVEVIVWMMAARAARSSSETLLAATGVRLATVFGHFLGTILVSVIALQSPDDALDMAGALIIFIYITMLIAMTAIPRLSIPFLPDLREERINQDEKKMPIAQAEAPSQPALNERIEQDQVNNKDSDGLPQDNTQNTEGNEAQPLRVEAFSEACDAVAANHDLTARERDVLEFLARGRTITYIESELFISRNTCKMHIRHVYNKLDVHSKQEVIDIVMAEYERQTPVLHK